jgi:hypothetical protein
MNMKLTSLAAAFALAAGMGAVNAEEAIQLTANQMDDITAGSYYGYYQHRTGSANASAGAYADCLYAGSCIPVTSAYAIADVVEGVYSFSYANASAATYQHGYYYY